jgi:hypothetical protein
VTIPNSVTSIGNNAFDGCTGLIKSAYPNSISNPFSYGIAISYPAAALIEDGIIWSSDKTKLYFVPFDYQGEFIIPNSVTSIGNYAFSDCTGITEINIADSETKLTIGSDAFSNVKPTKAYLGRNISSAIFTDDTNLSDLTIGDKVTYINYSAFYGCTGLTSVTIPNSVTSIGDDAFSGCTGLTSVTIPNSVTSIGSSAFYGCTGLTSVAIGNSVTSIGSDAFYGCSGLTSVTIPNSVTSIGAYAFSGCSGLTSVTIPNSVTSIGVYAFSGCSRLTKVNISDLAAWCSISFDDRYYGYTTHNYSSNPLYYAGHLYLNDQEITDLVIPDSVTSIGTSAFYGCTGLTSVTIPNSVTSIGSYAFYGCKGLTSVTIPNSVTSIGDYAFYGCTGVTELNIADGETKLTIGGSAFTNVKPTKAYLGRNISSAIFTDDTNLTDLTIGDKVTSINKSEFSGCTELEWIESKATTPPTIYSNTFSDFSVPLFAASEDYKTAAYWKHFTTVLVLTEYTPTGRTFEVDGLKYEIIDVNDCTCRLYGIDESVEGDVVIPATVTYRDREFTPIEISGILIKGETPITSLSIPSNIKTTSTILLNTSIAKMNVNTSITYGLIAFTSIDELVIASSVNEFSNDLTSNTIGKLTIEDRGSALATTQLKCSGLKELYLGRSVSENTFAGLTSLKKVSISDKVTSIGSSAFYGCTGLTSVTIPTSVTSIGDYAFAGCARLTSVTIGNSVTSIGDDAFLWCARLTSVTIPNSVTSIGDDAFAGCAGLTSVTIPNSVTSIGDDAFEGCARLTELNIADSKTELTIGSSAFWGVEPTKAYLGRNISSAIFTGDTNLSELTIGDKVTSINASEFSGCTRLTSVSIPETVTSIGGAAFYSCTGVTELNIADSETKLTIGGSDAFSNVKPTKVYLGRNLGRAIFTDDTNLTDLTIGDKVTAINNSEFSGCTSLSELRLPNSVTSIGNEAFYGCTGIAELKFEDGERKLTLGDDAFKDVTLKEIYFGRQMNFANAPISALETVEFGENVTSIETGEFKEAKSLLSVTSRNTVPPTTVNPFNDDTYFDGTLYVPATAIETYKAAEGWKNFWEVKAIDGTSSGIAEIADNSNAPFSVENGAICVDGDTDVRIVSMNGTTVYSGRGETRITLAPGVYIVIINNTPTKVVIK